MLVLTFSLLILSSHCVIKTQYSTSSCVCDITNSCDYLCCCDSECQSSTIQGWKKDNSCNPANDNGLAINFCSNTKSPQISDLYSGLRMIYQIIKRLFCLQSVNFKASSSAYNPIITKETASSLINNYISSYNSPVGLTNPYSNALSTRNGVCSWTQGFVGVDMPRRSCQGIIKNYQSNTSTLNIGNFQGNNVFLFDQSGNDVSNTTLSLSTSCSLTRGWTCNNIVCEANIQIVLNDDSTINEKNIELTLCNINNYISSTIQQIIGITYITSSSKNTNYQRAGNIGYTYESDLIVVNNANYSTLSPLTIRFADSEGGCVVNDSVNTNIWNIKFGQDFAIFCKYNSGSKYLNNIIDAFKYIGSIGNPNPNYALDYIQVANSVSNFNSAISILSISYYKIGQVGKSQFQIKSARIQTPSSSNLTSTDLFSFFIEFKQISTPIELFVPPPPTAQVKLDDDVLYPFL